VVIVQRVVMPVTGAVSWTVLDIDGAPVEPVESYLAYLSSVERSPNTQRAYATSLKLWFEFLDRIDRAWAEVGSTMSPGSCRGCGRPRTTSSSSTPVTRSARRPR
jgi:hypothetical protein